MLLCVTAARRCALVALIATTGVGAAAQDTFDDGVLRFSNLDGSNGFALHGVFAYDGAGSAVSSAGDLNGDGFDDVVVGAYYASPNFVGYAGQSFVVFGGSSVGSDGTFGLDDLDGSNGFYLYGSEEFDFSGTSVGSAGDVNDDGYDDLLIGAPNGNPDGFDSAGETYVVFGGPSIGSGGSVELGALDGSNGFAIGGIYEYDHSGQSVGSAGDFNGDGIPDILVGADDADANFVTDSGSAYVVYGGELVGASGEVSLYTLTAATGFIINGAVDSDWAGQSVDGIGDFNGDGFDDLVIGANGADPDSEPYAGASYVVFGNSSPGYSIDLDDLDGSNGFVLEGIDSDDYSGEAVSSAGDINGDGYEDLIIGAKWGGAGGESYVVFGGPDAGVSGTIELGDLDGENGFLISGANSGDDAGTSVSEAGDINGDGFDDLLVGAPYADAGSNNSGKSYVVYGGAEVGASGEVNLAGMDGVKGFTMRGVSANDHSGESVSAAGDFNGDGAMDVIVGAPDADPNGESGSGAAYIVFGVSELMPGDYNADGIVDAADYTVWRNHLGDPAGTLANDADGGEIGPDQFATWLEQYGQSNALDGATLPEPAGFALLALAMSLSKRPR